MMTKAGDRLIAAAEEMVSIAKGEAPAARIHVNGHSYVPEPVWNTDMDAAPRDGRTLLAFCPPHVEMLAFRSGQWRIVNYSYHGIDVSPTAWMSLPSPPTGEAS